MNRLWGSYPNLFLRKKVCLNEKHTNLNEFKFNHSEVFELIDTGTPPLKQFSYSAVFHLLWFFQLQKPCFFHGQGQKVCFFKHFFKKISKLFQNFFNFFWFLPMSLFITYQSRIENKITHMLLCFLSLFRITIVL